MTDIADTLKRPPGEDQASDDVVVPRAAFNRWIEDVEAKLDALRPGLVGAVARAAAASRNANDAELEAVRYARMAGVSWVEISTAAGWGSDVEAQHYFADRGIS